MFINFALKNTSLINLILFSGFGEAISSLVSVPSENFDLNLDAVTRFINLSANPDSVSETGNNRLVFSLEFF